MAQSGLCRGKMSSGIICKVWNIKGSLNVNVDYVINTSSLDQNVAGTLRAGDVIDVYVVEEQDDEYIAIQIGSERSVERSYDSSGTAITRDDTQTVAQVVTIPMPSSDTAYFLEELEKGTVKIVKYKSY